MGLAERKFMILQAIIDDYITTAMPVGSRGPSRIPRRGVCRPTRPTGCMWTG